MAPDGKFPVAKPLDLIRDEAVLTGDNESMLNTFKPNVPQPKIKWDVEPLERAKLGLRSRLSELLVMR